MPRPPISSCLKRVRCPVHGLARSTQRRHASRITPAEVKALLPSMKDSVVWKWDQVTMAMSGGVDSAVALRILSEWPIDLNVIFMRNWDSLLSESPSDDPSTTSYAYSSDPSSSKGPNMSPCGWQRDWESVQKVCAHVGIPENRVRLVDLSQEYWTRVFEPAINVWQDGGTPNPDVACNREIKFGALLEHVPRTNRSFLATGHYARVKRVPHATRLCRAEDLTKDQSYYLSAITEAQLRRALFPLAGIKKEDTRRLARYYGLPNAEKEESMGLCFVGERGKFGNFVSQYVAKPPAQGYLVDQEGKRLAPHDGLWHYTIGQRARIAGQLEPMFVAKKCIGDSKQDIMVVPGREHPALMCTRLHTHDFHWIAGKVPKGIVPGGKKRALVQLRHRMDPVPAVIAHDWNGEGLTIDLLEPVQGVAAGQVCAVYYLDWCIGSGIIKQTWASDTHPVKHFRAIKEAKGRPEDYYGAEESDRLDVEMEEVEEGDEDGEGGGDEMAALPRPLTGYAEELDRAEKSGSASGRDREESAMGHTRKPERDTTARTVVSQASRADDAPSTTTADFWASTEPALPSQSPHPAPTQQAPKARLAFGQYAVARSPLIKGFGAPRGYSRHTPFGSITKQFQRQDTPWQAPSAELDSTSRPGPRSNLSVAEGSKPSRAAQPRPRRGPAMERSERRSGQRASDLAGSNVELKDRPPAFEARQGDKQERPGRKAAGWRGRAKGKVVTEPEWQARGRLRGGVKEFGREYEADTTGKSRVRERGEFVARRPRASGFGMKRSA